MEVNGIKIAKICREYNGIQGKLEVNFEGGENEQTAKAGIEFFPLSSRL